MAGMIFLFIYIIIQTLISFITEFAVKNHKAFNKLGEKSRAIRIIVYGLLAIIPVFGTYLPKCKFKYFCMQFGNIWLGFFMFYATFVLLLVIILLCASKLRNKLKAKLEAEDDNTLVGHALHFAFILGLIFTIYGMVHSQNPRLVTYDIKLEQEAEQKAEKETEQKTEDKATIETTDLAANEASKKQMKVVLLADLHLSINSDIHATEKMVDIVNECDPDLIVVAGDIFTSNYEGLKNPEKYSAALSKMHAKYGVYAVCGNHDVEENLFSGFSVSPISEAFRTSDMDKFFQDAGFKVLYDEEVDIAGMFTLVGRVDGEKAGDGTNHRLSAEELLKNTDRSKPIVVMEHEPIEFKDLADNGADLVLCGHTHNGQIFPGNLIVPLFNENGYGVKEIHGTTTVVTAGVGYYGPPVRVGTNSEVTLLNIEF